MITHGQPAAKPSRVVILGASGFVGCALASHLQEWSIATLPLSSRDVDLCEAGSTAALERLLQPDDALVFISALTPDKGKDAGTMMRNLAMGRHVSLLLERPVCAHAVYVSSDAVYSDDAHPVREDSPCDPSSFHGLMHLVRERMLISAAQQSKVPLCVLRPCAIYGPGDTHNGYGPNRFVRTAVGDRKIALFGGGEEKRDHLFIRDLARLIGLALARRSRGILNVATGQAVSFHELARAVAALCSDAVAIQPLPRQSPVTHRHFDVTALWRAFPAFRVTSLREGLIEMRESLSAHPQPASAP